MSSEEDTRNPRVDAFLAEVRAVCECHGLAISHEDGHGAFEIVNIEDGDLGWFMAATDRTRTK